MTGQPKILAESLRKLGFYKYHSRVFELVNSGEWLKWDPHPPLYYRIKTLDNLDVTKIKHTLLSAIKGCVRGFTDSLSGK
jgi:heat shock protein HtpX